jgi:YD repeat-containing protein
VAGNEKLGKADTKMHKRDVHLFQRDAEPRHRWHGVINLNQLDCVDGRVHVFDGIPFSGFAIEVFPDGRLQMQMSLMHGREGGITRRWHPDGQLESEKAFRRGNPHGTRLELYTNSARGQTTTYTNPEGNLTIYVRFPENNPDGNHDVDDPSLSNHQYGRVKLVVADANPDTVMSLVGADGDMTTFIGNIIPRTNMPGVYQSLTTRHEGPPHAARRNYDPMGNVLATVDPRGNLTSFERNELGEIYRVTVPAPYSFQIETSYDPNRNVVRKGGHKPIVSHRRTLDPRSAYFPRPRLLRPADRAQRAFRPECPGRPLRPLIIAVRPTAGNRPAQRGQLLLRFRPVHQCYPPPGPIHRPGGQKRSQGTAAIVPGPQRTPPPVLRLGH